MSATIRRLEPADRDQWEPLWQAYLTFYEASVPDDVTSCTWDRLMRGGEDPAGFCAVDGGGRLVGIVHYHFHRSTWTVGDYCYLQDLYVASDARGGGVGAQLIEAVCQVAEQAGASQVYWLTQHFNETARRLYDHVGELTPFIKYKGRPLKST